MGLFRLFRRVQRSDSGNVLLLFALLLPFAMGVTALTIDYMVTNSSRNYLQEMADNAALLAMKNSRFRNGSNTDELKQFAQNYINEFYGDKKGGFKNAPTVDSVTITNGVVRFTLSGHPDVYFGKLTGQKITTHSSLSTSEASKDIVLVLDISGSMNSSNKINDLKDATNQFISDMLPDAAARSRTKIGIVPFNAFVNIKSSQSDLNGNYLNWSTNDAYDPLTSLSAGIAGNVVGTDTAWVNFKDNFARYYSGSAWSAIDVRGDNPEHGESIDAALYRTDGSSGGSFTGYDGKNYTGQFSSSGTVSFDKNNAGYIETTKDGSGAYINQDRPLTCGTSAASAASTAANTALNTALNATHTLINSEGFENIDPNFRGHWFITTNLDSWQVVSGNVDVIMQNRWKASEGLFSIDLNGNQVGTIQKTITTIPGKDYVLTFKYTKHPDIYNFSGLSSVSFRASAAGQSKNFTYGDPNTATNMMYKTGTFHFTATSNLTNVQIQSTTYGGCNCAGPVLDDLKIYELAYEGFEFVDPDFRTGLFTTTNVGSWQMVSGNVNVVLQNYWQSAEGLFSIDLNGIEVGTIQKTITTIPGKDYVLAFKYSKDSNTPAIVSFRTSAAGQSKDFTYGDPNTATNMMYKTGTFQFTANSTTTTVQIQSTTNNGCCWGPVFDRIVIYQAPPPVNPDCRSMPVWNNHLWIQRLLQNDTSKMCVEMRSVTDNLDVQNTAATSADPKTLYIPYRPYAIKLKSDYVNNDGKMVNQFGAQTPENYTITQDDGEDIIRERSLNKYYYLGALKLSNSSSASENFDKTDDDRCSTPILPMQNQISPLQSMVNNLVANGHTNINNGLLWGWNLLNNRPPFNQNAANASNKYLILVSDGANYYQDYNAFGTLTDNRFNQSFASIAAGNAKMDERLLQLCTNIKAAGIKIFVIATEMSETSQATIKQCVSSPAYYYDVQDSAKLTETLAKIQYKVSNMKLRE